MSKGASFLILLVFFLINKTAVHADVNAATGSFVVIYLYPESKTTTINTETWSSTRVSTVNGQLNTGKNWYVSKAPSGANLSILSVYYSPSQLPIDYEPIRMSSSSEGDWINDCMDELGFSSIFLNYMDEVRSCNSWNANYWGVSNAWSMFIVDSYNDADHKFTDGKSAYAYLGGPFAVLTWGNGGWINSFGNNHMQWVGAHEMGHIFRAADQYAGSNRCSYSWNGYSNQNSEDCPSGPYVSSIMRQDAATYPPISTSGTNIDYWAQGMFNWSPSSIPNNPTSISSLSHSLYSWSSDRTVDVSWSGASHQTSGIAGYSWDWTTSSSTIPDQTFDGSGTSATSFSLSDGSSWYFHIRAKSNAGGWNSGATHYGPFYIDGAPPNNPTSVSSSTHTTSSWSGNKNITMNWSGASDALSGVSGYSWTFDQSSTTIPDASQDGSGSSTSSSSRSDGTNHYFHIRTRDNAGNWNSSAVHRGPYWIDGTAPSNPSSFSSSTHSINSWSTNRNISISWSGASDGGSGIAGYSWEWISSWSAYPPDYTVDGSGNSTTSQSLADGGSWYFAMRTKDVAENWNDNNATYGPFKIDATAPPPPSIASSSHSTNSWSSDRTIDISWNVPNDGNGSGVTGYSFLFDQSSNTLPGQSVTGTGTSTTSSSLSDGSNYYFHIRARDAVGNWGDATHYGPFYIDVTAPNNPTTVSSPSHNTATWSMDNTIDMTWSGASDNLSGVSGYSWTFDQSSSTIPDAVQDGSASSTTSSPLSDGTNWYFHIRTRDNAGNWNSGAGQYTQVPEKLFRVFSNTTVGPYWIDATAPSNPTTFLSSSHTPNVWSSNRTISVSWSGASDGSGSGIAGYSWEWSTSPSTIPDETVDGAGNSTTSSSLSDGNSWYFHIRTKDNIGNWRNDASHYGPFYIDGTVPSNPTSISSSSHVLSTFSNDRTVDIAWSGADDGSGSGINGYSWEWTTSPSTIPDQIIDGSSTSTASPSLADGINWYFHIRTKDNAGSWNSDAVHYGPFYIDRTAPNNPATVSSPSHQVSVWSADRTIDISWSGANDGSGSGIAGYSWEWSTSSTTLPDETVDGTGESATSSSLDDGNSWYFHIRTKDNANNWSNAVHYGPFYIDGTAPSNPTSLSSSSHQLNIYSNDRTIDISWSGANDGSGSGIAGYSWEWSTLSTTLPDETVDGTGESATSPSLDDGNSWYFHIRTKDNAGYWNSDAVHYGPFYIDGTAPSNPTSLSSSSHQLNIYSN
ncbi:MAG: hypothetical protein HY707_14530, partial [Ignavibacteriae bacterium]|nr:hypothetical protein [Ignavibacteriota bacterium]